MFTILMVCTGNTCRSPMAAAVLQNMADNLGWAGKIKAASAGVAASFGSKASKNAALAMKKRGLDLSGHQASQLTEKKITDADLILTMTVSHKKIILSVVPEAAAKVFTLPEFALANESLDVNDPFGADENGYELCAREICCLIEKSWEKIVARLAGNPE